MLCCWSPPVVPDREPPLIVDLKEVLCDIAWGSYRSSLGTFKKLALKRHNFDIEVPEHYFDFKTIPRDPGDKTPIKSRATVAETDFNTDPSGPLNVKGPPNPEVVTVDTEFSNETAQPQLYKFRFEKNRKTEIDVTFQKGITLGGKANFSIGVPFGDAGVESELQFQVTKSEGQKFEQSMVMEATSDIAVGPNSRYTANVQLEERNLHEKFEIVTRMSMPQKRAPVYIKRKSDGKEVFVMYVNNLVDAFIDTVPCAKIVTGENGAREVHMIDFVVEGVIKGTLACNHKISLTSNEPEALKKEKRDGYTRIISER